MKCRLYYQTAFGLILIFALLQSSPCIAATKNAGVSDAHIRAVVENLLHEKNQKIEQLEARIKQLENSQAIEKKQVASIDAKKDNVNSKNNSPENLSLPPGYNPKTAAKNSGSGDASIMNKLGDLGDEIEELKEAAEEKGLDISGFFDVNAKTDNSTDQTFSVGSVELDLEYAYRSFCRQLGDCIVR